MNVLMAAAVALLLMSPAVQAQKKRGQSGMALRWLCAYEYDFTKQGTNKMIKRLHIVIAVLSCISAVHAYQVRIGTAYTPGAVLNEPEQWRLTAQGVNGLNVNITDNGIPVEERNTVAEWQGILSQYTTANQNGMIKIARSNVSNQYVVGKNTIEKQLEILTATQAARYGYTARSVMFYDNKVDGTYYEWTEPEVQQIRDWLDANGQSEVELLYNARNFFPKSQAWAESTLVDGILMESGLDLWVDNVGDRQGMLTWLTTNSITENKDIIIQVPCGPGTETNPSSYIKFRQMVSWFSSTNMFGTFDFVRRDNVYFLPVVYNANWSFAPEIGTDEQYADSLTGLALSLIEQKSVFEGRVGSLTEDFCTSYQRNAEVIELETGTLAGPSASVATKLTGYSGAGYVYLGADNSNQVSVSFSCRTAGSYPLRLHYARGMTSGAHTLKVFTNGVYSASIDLRSVGTNGMDWGIVNIPLTLKAGSNTLTFQRASQRMLLDRISIGKPYEADRKPNIIIIFTDDHGYTDLGVHNIDPNVQTPVLDSLAAGGALKRRHETLNRERIICC